ncbi:unnamed protein product [Caenorhabditis angaria]|uniref:F-box domain-containing protein n=1 Tax=Caenorhabditis angaria TaxID=860376 RepID=A0A9P1I857_9PELO|nr:unnamed protein product [Caenorhabditis angaria]
MRDGYTIPSQQQAQPPSRVLKRGDTPSLTSVSLEENAPETTGWFDIPYEMRKIVIDEMDVETRCRFEICSRKCEDETKMSKKLLTRIAIRQRISAENIFCWKIIDQNSTSYQ